MVRGWRGIDVGSRAGHRAGTRIRTDRRAGPGASICGRLHKGDTKAAAAACADQTSILDEFPPHEWHGSGACAKWMSDYDADAKKNGITDGVVTLSTPSHVDISADRAYVVVPANYAFKQKGKPVNEVGSIITLALQKSAAGWRITGWSWAKH